MPVDPELRKLIFRQLLVKDLKHAGRVVGKFITFIIGLSAWAGFLWLMATWPEVILSTLIVILGFLGVCGYLADRWDDAETEAQKSAPNRRIS